MAVLSKLIDARPDFQNATIDLEFTDDQGRSGRAKIAVDCAGDVIINLMAFIGVIRQHQVEQGKPPVEVQTFHPESLDAEIMPTGQPALILHFARGTEVRVSVPISAFPRLRLRLAELETMVSRSASA